MRFEDLHELAAVYAIGALDPTEEAEFEAHLKSCDRCRRDLLDFAGVIEGVARASAVGPPPELRTRVLDEISRTPQATSDDAPTADHIVDLTQERERRLEWRSVRVLTAAAAVVFVVGGAIALSTLARGDDAYDMVASAADAESLVLDGEDGAITVVYSPELDRVGVTAIDLADPGAGKTYALWLFIEDGVAPAGLFVPADGAVRAVLSVDDFETSGFGVTIEPEGGSDQPTGPVLFSGTFDT